MKEPPTLQPDFSLAKFETWRKVWKDYVEVTGWVEYPREKQLGLFRNTLSMEMRSVLEHELDVKEDTARRFRGPQASSRRGL